MTIPMDDVIPEQEGTCPSSPDTLLKGTLIMNHMDSPAGAPKDHDPTGTCATPPPGVAPFTPTDVALFQREDRSAAAAVIGLMASIFVMGIGLYLIVCYSVM